MRNRQAVCVMSLLLGAFLALGLPAPMITSTRHSSVPTLLLTNVGIASARAQGAQQAPTRNAFGFRDTGRGTRIFTQRECSGQDDCVRANIELEQTEASRTVNRLSRMSQRQSVLFLGKPDYVLRAGDKVPVEYYANNPTENGFARAIIMWRNGPCAANELHVTGDAANVRASVMTGGNECTIDGKPFPMPTEHFSCEKGRRSDPLCKPQNILRLPGL